MEFHRCQPPCARFIAREDPHSKCIKCLGFSHARDMHCTSKCKICDDFRLITLRSRLEDCERESSIFPRRASSTSAAPREIAASREAATWGSDVELEEMESEQTGLAFSAQPKRSRLLSSNSCRGDQGTILLPPPLCLGSSRSPERSPLAVEPRSFSRQQPRKRANLKRPNKPAASANPGHS